ncbi:hypothetical protein [Streptomyces sp. NPDC017991]|uniref:hypothetical protein n=1 Tax=Streptomyces sp. NPDC017991 TaxID=3365026 RepID=UPI00378B96C3
MSPTRFASEHRWLYAGALVLLVVLAVVGVIQYGKVKTGTEAAEKAGELADAAVAAGYPRPDTGTIERTLGTDGGNVCDDPAGALKSALWKTNVSNGAAFVGQRPVIGDKRAIHAEATILKVYCPDELHRIQDRIDDLRTDTTVRR